MRSIVEREVAAGRSGYAAREELAYNRVIMRPTITEKVAGPDHQWLRHALATLAYRGGKTLRGAPPGFAEFRVGERTRTPGQILAHLGDLVQWALTQAKGKPAWHNSAAVSWEEGSAQFFAALQELDEYLASNETIGCTPQKMFQGAIADALDACGATGDVAGYGRGAGARVRITHRQILWWDGWARSRARRGESSIEWNAVARDSCGCRGRAETQPTRFCVD